MTLIIFRTGLKFENLEISSRNLNSKTVKKILPSYRREILDDPTF